MNREIMRTTDVVDAVVGICCIFAFGLCMIAVFG